jgi:hypothetical protein
VGPGRLGSPKNPINQAEILGSITPPKHLATSLAKASSTPSVARALITMKFEGRQWHKNAFLAHATYARVASSWGSQKVMSIARYRSMAADSSARAGSR